MPPEVAIVLLGTLDFVGGIGFCSEERGVTGDLWTRHKLSEWSRACLFSHWLFGGLCQEEHDVLKCLKQHSLKNRDLSSYVRGQDSSA